MKTIKIIVATAILMLIASCIKNDNTNTNNTTNKNYEVVDIEIKGRFLDKNNLPIAYEYTYLHIISKYKNQYTNKYQIKDYPTDTVMTILSDSNGIFTYKTKLAYNDMYVYECALNNNHNSFFGFNYYQFESNIFHKDLGDIILEK